MGKEEALQLIKEAAKTGATELGLSWQDLTELPPELFQLKNLTELYLSNNQLTSLPPELFELKNLTKLNLSGNQLTSLPPELFELKNLTTLDLRGNQLSSLPPEIFALKNLTTLWLSGNQLTTLPPELFQLKNLTKLGLSYNQLSSLPPELFQLKNLTKLYLFDNQLTSLPPEIAQLPKLERLELFDNPLVSPPYELADQGIEAIREYFASLEEGGQELAEVKIILVGEGASGKTSLTRCLRGQCFNEHEPTTHGIRIKDWQIDTPERLVRCKLWDFGGQEIMHATHQFFLSRRCLYVLVLDGRRDERPEYWLRYIETLGGNSPVLVVLNKQDANSGFDLNRPFLQEKYPFIKDFWRTSCKTGNGLTEFKEALREELAQVPLIKNQWPASWFRAKERLEHLQEPRISYEKFEGILADAGVKGETTQKVLGAFLHDLGIVIHFDQFELKDHHVLDPKWVTEAVYKIINAPSIAEAKGLLKVDDLEEILRKKQDDEHRYYPADHVYIIELMKEFELCYALNDQEVLIPQLLAVPEPRFEFDYEDSLRFVLHYEDFLPPSIMPRFMVKRHQEIGDNPLWRTGVVLFNAILNAKAAVRVDNEARRIHIAVTGKERKVFLALIWLTFRELHIGFEGLQVDELLPLPDDPTLTVDYETLVNYAEQGLEKIIPKGTKKAYKVQELLDRVHLDNPAQGEQVLALVKQENKGGLRWVAEKLNRYVEADGFELFGIKLKHKAIFEDLLKATEKQPPSEQGD